MRRAARLPPHPLSAQGRRARGARPARRSRHVQGDASSRMPRHVKRIVAQSGKTAGGPARCPASPASVAVDTGQAAWNRRRWHDAGRNRRSRAGRSDDRPPDRTQVWRRVPADAVRSIALAASCERSASVPPLFPTKPGQPKSTITADSALIRCARSSMSWTSRSGRCAAERSSSMAMFCAMRSTSDAAAAKQRSLDTVDDPVARRYLRVTAHADLATEPHLTNGLNGLKNFVMDVPGYVAYCAIDGGMGRLAHRLAANIPDTAIQCGARVVRIEATPDGGFRIHCASDHGRFVAEFDMVRRRQRTAGRIASARSGRDTPAGWRPAGGPVRCRRLPVRLHTERCRALDRAGNRPAGFATACRRSHDQCARVRLSRHRRGASVRSRTRPDDTGHRDAHGMPMTQTTPPARSCRASIRRGTAVRVRTILCRPAEPDFTPAASPAPAATARLAGRARMQPRMRS